MSSDQMMSRGLYLHVWEQLEPKPGSSGPALLFTSIFSQHMGIWGNSCHVKCLNSIFKQVKMCDVVHVHLFLISFAQIHFLTDFSPFLFFVSALPLLPRRWAGVYTAQFVQERGAAAQHFCCHGEHGFGCLHRCSNRDFLSRYKAVMKLSVDDDDDASQ